MSKKKQPKPPAEPTTEPTNPALARLDGEISSLCMRLGAATANYEAQKAQLVHEIVSRKATFDAIRKGAT